MADQRAAVHQLTRFVGRALGAVLAQHQDLGIGDGLADRIGPAVHLLGRQIGAAEGLGQAVHQEGLGRAHAGAGPAASRAACARRCWRSSAGGRRWPAGQSSCGELDVQRRHGREAGDLLALHRLEHVARQQVVQQHHARAAWKAVVSWLKPASKDSGSAASRVSSAGCPGSWPRSWRRPPCCGGTAPRPWGGRCCRWCRGWPACRCRTTAVERAPVVQHQRCGHRQPGGPIGQHHMREVGATAQLFLQARQALGRGDQHPHVAVAQDEAHLLGLEQGVDGHEGTAGGRGSKGRHHHLETLLEVDAHARAARQRQAGQRRGDTVDLQGQRLVGPGGRPMGQGRRGGRAVGRPRDEVVQQEGFGHGGAAVGRARRHCSATVPRSRDRRGVRSGDRKKYVMGHPARCGHEREERHALRAGPPKART
jgi:hypothetical protein